jgi:hypothetical protein
VNAKAKSKPGITLNFFGEGYNVLRFDENRLTFREIEHRAMEMKLEIDRAVLDLEFYEPFAEQGLKSWKDITLQVTRGSVVNRLSWMEIRSEGKKRKTHILEELFLADTLFPLCDFAIEDKTVVKNVSGSFYILEKEVGKIDTFLLEGSVPDLEHLRFSLERYNLPGKELLLLSGVSCKGESLIRKDTDTVISTMRMILT